MGLKYILNQVGNKIGLNPSDTDQRATLLRFVNEAAWELYQQSDMPGSLMEMVIKVNGDQTIALPRFVGDLRAVREYNSQIPWHINQMRPRYNYANWSDMWRNWRIKGKQALQRSVRNQSLVTAVVDVVEVPNLLVTISGPTASAAMTNEVLQMDALSKTTVNNFLDISSVTKNRYNAVNVSIQDVDGLELTVVNNNELEAAYLIIDVSTFPWLNQSMSLQDHYLEVLFKRALVQLSDDGDEFPASGCDNIIVNKAMQLWAEEQGKGELALGYDSKATRSLARITEEQNRATEDTVALIPNGHDELLVKIRPNKPGRYRWGYPYLLR